ncbi:MAG: HD domain-containing protein [candidate division Zixibacteria bacterium]|nr:HD domain-containing protein [candidate division Zixibacteria bacterium]
MNFDLYVQVDRNKLSLYRSAALPFTEATMRRLIEHGVTTLYIDGSSRKEYQIYMEENLAEILRSPDLPEAKKASILYDTSTELIRDVLENPTYGENIRRSKNMVQNTISYMLQGREAFLNLLRLTSVNYTVYTHSVNVCTLSVALAQRLKNADQKFLYELGIGALLHDIGKARVSERILNKTTALSAMEQEIMRRHPRWGVEMLRETGEVPAAAYSAVLQHHERGGRKGYPDKLDMHEMHVYGKIVAIADSFDAMTTERVYQKAMETYPALKLMHTLKGHFDSELLREFTMLLGPDGEPISTSSETAE